MRRTTRACCIKHSRFFIPLSMGLLPNFGEASPRFWGVLSPCFHDRIHRLDWMVGCSSVPNVPLWIEENLDCSSKPCVMRCYASQGSRWPQAELARRVNATPKVISNLERGVRVNLEPELLLRLADVFRLTSRERTVFFECATGLRLENVPRPGHSAEEIMASVLNLLGQYRLPAFVVDDYDNVVAANDIILPLVSGGWGLMDDAPQQPGGFNVMRIVFSDRSPLGRNIVEERENFLLQTVYFFPFCYAQTPRYPSLPGYDGCLLRGTRYEHLSRGVFALLSARGRFSL